MDLFILSEWSSNVEPWASNVALCIRYTNGHVMTMDMSRLACTQNRKILIRRMAECCIRFFFLEFTECCGLWYFEFIISGKRNSDYCPKQNNSCLSLRHRVAYVKTKAIFNQRYLSKCWNFSIWRTLQSNFNIRRYRSLELPFVFTSVTLRLSDRCMKTSGIESNEFEYSAFTNLLFPISPIKMYIQHDLRISIFDHFRLIYHNELLLVRTIIWLTIIALNSFISNLNLSIELMACAKVKWN